MREVAIGGSPKKGSLGCACVSQKGRLNCQFSYGPPKDNKGMVLCIMMFIECCLLTQRISHNPPPPPPMTFIFMKDIYAIDFYIERK